MKISLIDRSNYLRGLLLLIRKDRTISEPEKSMMMQIGKALGFDHEFCEHAINEILENQHIDDEPPVFKLQELAEKFIRDGLILGLCDHDGLHIYEEEWLRLTAKKNSLDSEWFDELLSNTVKSQANDIDFGAYHLVVD